MSKLERDYQAKLIKKIKAMLPDCIVIKNDPNYLQGVPDLTVFYPGGFTVLEVKRSATASHQPNQDYYIDKLHGMSYAAFIYPENEEEVLSEVQLAYDDARRSCILES